MRIRKAIFMVEHDAVLVADGGDCGGVQVDRVTDAHDHG
jgi:hypothetical protein